MQVLLAVLAVVTAVTSQCLTPDDKAGEKALNLYQGQLQFSVSMLKTVSTQDPHSNIFFSPLSVYSTLLLAYFISANHTEQSLHKALNFPTDMKKSSVMKAYREQQLRDKASAGNNSSNGELTNANHLFVSQNLTIKECMAELFKEELEKVDFRQNEQVTNHINQWVSKQTHGHIKDIIPPGSLSTRSKLVLANAAYFKGLWVYEFTSSDSKDGTFHISKSEKAPVTMMRQSEFFSYVNSEELDAHVVQLPYKNNVSMFVFLPNNVENNVTNLIMKLTPEYLNQILSGEVLSPTQMHLQLPKFTVEKELKLVKILNELGVGDLFESSADLSMLTGEPGIKLDEALHKAKVQVDEKGTTAAAATALLMLACGNCGPLELICDHPFMYLLYDHLSKTILFSGVFNAPE